MKKLFYTNPLIAAYMQTTFGIEFAESFEVNVKWNCFERWSMTCQKPVLAKRFYVAESCHERFAPAQGDIIRQGAAIYIFGPDVANTVGFDHDARPAIISRMDSPFFMPEMEQTGEPYPKPRAA